MFSEELAVRGYWILCPACRVKYDASEELTIGLLGHHSCTLCGELSAQPSAHRSISAEVRSETPGYNLRVTL